MAPLREGSTFNSVAGFSMKDSRGHGAQGGLDLLKLVSRTGQVVATRQVDMLEAQRNNLAYDCEGIVPECRIRTRIAEEMESSEDGSV